MNETQLVFKSQGGAVSQTDKLINLLHNADGQWISLPVIVQAIGGYAAHSRVADARKLGINIENRVEYDPVTKKRFSFYRLLAP